MTAALVTAEHLYELLLSEYPEIHALVLEMNAVTLVRENPEVANILYRVISASPDRAGRKYASTFFESMIRATSSFYDEKRKRNTLPPASRIRELVREGWNRNRIRDIARMWATRNAAQEIGVPFNDLFGDVSLNDWLHRTYLPTRLDTSALYDDRHWNAISLLRLFLLKEGNYGVLTSGNVNSFVCWVEQQDDIKEIAVLIAERNTIDPKQLSALLDVTGSLAAPVQSGAL